MSIFRICFALYFLKLPALIGGGGGIYSYIHVRPNFF